MTILGNFLNFLVTTTYCDNQKQINVTTVYHHFPSQCDYGWQKDQLYGMPTKNTNIVTNINFLVKTVLVPPWANFRKFGLLFNPPLNYNKLRILTSERLLHDMLHAACFLACCVLTLSTVHCFLLQTTFDFSFFLSRYLHRITTVGCFFCLS